MPSKRFPDAPLRVSGVAKRHRKSPITLDDDDDFMWPDAPIVSEGPSVPICCIIRICKKHASNVTPVKTTVGAEAVDTASDASADREVAAIIEKSLLCEETL